MLRMDHLGAVLNAILSKLGGEAVPGPAAFSLNYLDDMMEFAEMEGKEVRKIMELR